MAEFVRPIRKALKFLLPHGIVETAKVRQRFRRHGGELPAGNFLRGEWLAHEAATAGLDLLPEGAWKRLRSVVDVGGNVGEWSAMLLDLVRPERLIFIEPIPAALERARQRLRHSRGTTQIAWHTAAVGDHEGTAQLNVTRDTTGSSVLPPADAMRELVGANWTVAERLDVPMRTLDSLLAGLESISLLKIDVQGFEREALAGAAKCLRRTDYVLIELNFMPQYEGGSWLADVHQILTRQHPFVLADASKPLRLNGRASMCDGLYVNIERLPSFASREIV